MRLHAFVCKKYYIINVIRRWQCDYGDLKQILLINKITKIQNTFNKYTQAVKGVVFS